MDKRKKLVKLFYEIEEFIRQKSLDCDPYVFLLNKFHLSLLNKRPAAAALFGISRNDFSLLNNEFSDRLGHDFVLSLSLTAILSLPSEKVIEVQNIKVQPKQSVLVLTDTVVLPYEIEKKVQLFIGYTQQRTHEQPFKNVEYYPVSRSANLSISIQATLFDLMDEDNTQLKPQNFDVVVDDSVHYPFPSGNLLDTLSVLLRPNAVFYLMAKKVFLSSPLTRKDKKNLYTFFETEEIDRFPDFLFMKLVKKQENHIDMPQNTVVIRDSGSGKTLELDRKYLDSNHLFTFNDGVSAEQLAIVSKIEERSGATCGDYFKFFLGMFRNVPVDNLISSLRKNGAYQPFVISKEVVPFNRFKMQKYIYPDPDVFAQIPLASSFESKKLIMKYLSVKPVFAYDEDGFYFMNDVAAVVPRTPEIDLFFAEGYLNSKLVEFFYKIKFPHHNKFLKKNFDKIPFLLCGKSLQTLITNQVLKIRALYSSMALYGSSDEQKKEVAELTEMLDGFVYQLYRLTPDEVAVIERYLGVNSENPEVRQ